MEKWFETIFYSERVNGGCGCACINQAKVPIATSHPMICWYIDSFVCRPSIKSTHVCASAVTSTCTTNKNATRTSHTGTHCYRNTNIWNIRIWSSNVTEHWLNPSNDDDDNGDVMTHCHRCLCLCHECKHEVSFAFLSLSIDSTCHSVYQIRKKDPNFICSTIRAHHVRIIAEFKMQTVRIRIDSFCSVRARKSWLTIDEYFISFSDVHICISIYSNDHTFAANECEWSTGRKRKCLTFTMHKLLAVCCCFYHAMNSMLFS